MNDFLVAVKVLNVPDDESRIKQYIVANVCEGELWYYGSWSNKEDAVECANTMPTALLLVKE